jgi:hypothetical protein
MSDMAVVEGFAMNMAVSKAVFQQLQNARNESGEPTTEAQKTVDKHIAAVAAQAVSGFGA